MARNSTKPDYEDYDPYGGQIISFDPATGKFTSSGTNSPMSTTGDIDGEGKGWLSSLWNKWTGAATTGQQDELNEFSAEQAFLNREWQSSEAAKNRKFQAEQAQLDYDRQVEFYEKFQSIGAQVQQYKDAGLNPSLLTGGVSPSSSAPSGASPAGAMPSGSAASATSPMSSPTGLAGFMGQILNLLKLRSEIDVNKSLSRKNISDAEHTDKVTSWIDVTKQMDIQEASQRIKESSERVNQLIASTAKTYSDIDVNNNTIEIGNQRISLMGSQEELNASQTVLNRLKAKEIELLLPYVQRRAEADYALTVAKTSEARASAERQLYEANVRMLEGMREADLIDKGYYDKLVEQAEYDVKTSKRNYKWKPLNDICSNVSKLCVGFGSLVGAIKGLPSTPMTSSVTRNTNYPDMTEVPQTFWD